MDLGDIDPTSLPVGFPMFPLGTVVVPTQVLNLHVFEPRYRTLVRHLLDGELPGREFGVVLIERGREVGGGDVRRPVGTTVELVEAEPFPDGRWALTAVGVRRIRVRQWLDDAPYPRADVEDWPEPPASDDVTVLLGETWALVAEIYQALSLIRDLPEVPELPALDQLSDEPARCAHQLCMISPLGAADRYDLLAAGDVGERLALLQQLLRDRLEEIELRRRTS